ncbi:type II toxin-antitoxin system RelE/ParE family toxin [Cecembia rubra]|uniref:Plasmid stabilization system protein ParE n=1 Tax=Cecembia rubra TaxID=1485585 RepID=A0A2P8E0G8_9BACT|nr:type II toxin-antitoxin system RelE/ParE family toxin [Cecembia rubra]PSL02950.1 plasmid stabilization system protein ParE [Cecembia rubra]
MKVIYTNQSLNSLEELIEFLKEKQGIPVTKINALIKNLLDKADHLKENPLKGQTEEYLSHLGLDHRRLIEGYIKILYRTIDDSVYITDFFDTRQDPKKMKG